MCSPHLLTRLSAPRWHKYNKIRYIDQTQGLMDDDESGPGLGDLEVYEKVVSFLSGNVEPSSYLDDISLAYVQIPLLAMEGEYSAHETRLSVT
jgi:hypothetical protein